MYNHSKHCPTCSTPWVQWELAFPSFPHCITISGPVLLGPRMLLHGAVPAAFGFSLPAQSQPGAPLMHKDKCPPSKSTANSGSAECKHWRRWMLGRLAHPHLAGARVKKIPNPTRKQLSWPNLEMTIRLEELMLTHRLQLMH